MSSVNGMPIFNTAVNGSNGIPAKKGKMFKWIIAIIIILVVLYFLRNSRSKGRSSGESCRYNSDCQNKKCKCKNGKALCSRYNKTCA
jgi:hypothetical protein